jgi:hypothetical protein
MRQRQLCCHSNIFGGEQGSSCPSRMSAGGLEDGEVGTMTVDA